MQHLSFSTQTTTRQFKKKKKEKREKRERVYERKTDMTKCEQTSQNTRHKETERIKFWRLESATLEHLDQGPVGSRELLLAESLPNR
jgi:hypothetical protein